jgi:hypothetical protein
MSSPGFFPDSPFIGPIVTRIPLEQRVSQLSDQLSSLRINNSNQRADLDSTFDELKKIKASFDSLAEDIKDINSMKTLYSNFVQLKLTLNNKVNRLQLSINGILQLVENKRVVIQQNTSQLIELALSRAGATQDVPELQYAQFLGNPKETKQFTYCVSQICWKSMDLFFSSQSPVSYFEDWKMVTTIQILACQSTRLPTTP